MIDPTNEEYEMLCRTLHETVSACTPTMLVGGVVAADLAAQIVSAQEVAGIAQGAPPGAMLADWLVIFHRRYDELLAARHQRIVAEVAPQPAPAEGE